MASWIISSWIERTDLASLQPVLALHYRYRFDPHGLNANERSALNSHVQSWLEQHQDKKAPGTEDTEVI